MSTRYLCSHLVEIHVAGTQRPPIIANLERIEAEIAVAAVEQPLPLQAQALLQAAGFAAPATVERCLRRETDYEAVLVFRDGFQWSPELWTPDHLYRLDAAAKGASGAS